MTRSMIALLLIALCAAPAHAQGKGQGKGQEKQAERAQGRAQAPGQAKARERGQPPGQVKAAERGKAKAKRHVVRLSEIPRSVRPLADRGEPHGRFIAGAVTVGARDGLREDELRIRRVDDRLFVADRNGDLLLDVSAEDVRDLGAWEARRVHRETERAGAPAFCRSGAGHPVWGRDWCVAKGFGLADRDWGRVRLDDARWERPTDTGRLDRGGLIDVLGDIVFNRLALQSLMLGHAEPLNGTWLAPQDGPRILRIHAGSTAIAEFLDADRDDRPDVLVIALGG